MNTKKKCCENCIKLSTSQQTCARPSREPCVWQRDPDLWLDILPEEEGVYWWRVNPTAKHRVYQMAKEHIRVLKHSTRHTDEQWQGPIKPKE